MLVELSVIILTYFYENMKNTWFSLFDKYSAYFREGLYNCIKELCTLIIIENIVYKLSGFMLLPPKVKALHLGLKWLGCLYCLLWLDG